MEKDSFKYTFLPVTSISSGLGKEVLPDLYILPIQIVNVYFVGEPNGEWVLIDAGMPHSANEIITEAEERFGKNSPSAIILTHGHFDHVGAIEPLLDYWGISAFAHSEELPYLTGKKNYPEGDPTVDGGLMSEVSPLYPNHAISLGHRIQPLPEEGSIPGMPKWRWIHTPGHTPGHISLFREEDRTLIAGDAFVNVKQESLYKVILQKPEISGPPKYFTTNWDAARDSVEKLATLNPKVAVTGHGQPLQDEKLTIGLRRLVDHFDTIALPEHGRFLH